MESGLQKVMLTVGTAWRGQELGADKDLLVAVLKAHDDVQDSAGCVFADRVEDLAK